LSYFVILPGEDVMARSDSTTIEIAGHEVRLSNPGKIFFPEIGVTKLDLAQYYLTVSEQALNHLRNRPTVLKRFVNGASEEPFFQKRVPDTAPEWIETATITFPSGRHAREMLPNDAAHLIWGVNLGVIDWNPWPVRAPDLDHPDELRVDLDPTPEATWDDVRQVALCAGEVLKDFGLTGFPKTSGSRGIHINVRIDPEHGFTTVRRCAVALAREIERRVPELATTKWWKEERHGVFIDYNQNARDRTVASAYSVRPMPDARVSTPLRWDEVADVEAEDLTIKTVPARVAEVGDPSAEIDAHSRSLQPLIDQVKREEEQGLEDAAWPPTFAKQPGEPKRVQPSRARKSP
jgi:bifunctional non-homologous end joining protein LigD